MGFVYEQDAFALGFQGRDPSVGAFFGLLVGDVFAAKGVFALSKLRLQHSDVCFEIIDDLLGLLDHLKLDRAIIVGHSYGGWPISGAAERLVGKIASIVYVDAFVPENGQRGMDLSSAQFRQALQEAIAKGEAGRPVPDANVFKIIEPRDVRCVQSKMTPQPTFVSTSPIALTGARERIARKTYIRATGYPQPAFDGYLAAAKADRSWRTFELSARESGHDIMVDAPRRLAEILVEVRATTLEGKKKE